MKTQSRRLAVLGMAATIAASALFARADNPIIQTVYTADPSPIVVGDTLYLYTGHDEDDAIAFKMFDWRCFSTTDMVNWTDRGVIASTETFAWAAKNGAWAAQVVPHKGKYYLYTTCAQKNGAMAVGVAVADSPVGPFKDAIGKPLIANSRDDIDPTVYIDQDGQAYLYWGNPNLYYVKLNADMISYSGGIVKIDSKPANYQEGPWFYRRGDKYYLAYASTCCPEGIGYSMSDSPTGPWEYKGMIMDADPVSSGNHPGIVDYKGSTYVFGFNYDLARVGVERRSVCVEKMTYNPDGTIQKLPFWSAKGPPQLAPLDPYVTTDAATICWSSGLKSSKRDGGRPGVYLTEIHTGDYIKVKGVDFGQTGAVTLKTAVASGGKGGTIEVKLDSAPWGKTIARVEVPATGGWEAWQTVTTAVRGATGKHDVYFIFKGDDGTPLFNFDSWQFEKTP